MAIATLVWYAESTTYLPTNIGKYLLFVQRRFDVWEIQSCYLNTNEDIYFYLRSLTSVNTINRRSELIRCQNFISKALILHSKRACFAFDHSNPFFHLWLMRYWSVLILYLQNVDHTFWRAEAIQFTVRPEAYDVINNYHLKNKYNFQKCCNIKTHFLDVSRQFWNDWTFK